MDKDKLFLNIYDYIDNTSVDIFNSDSKELCVIEIKIKQKACNLTQRKQDRTLCSAR